MNAIHLHLVIGFERNENRSAQFRWAGLSTCAAGGSASATCADPTVSCRLGAVARLAQGLPVARAVPEQRLVASVIHDVVNHRCSGDLALGLAHPAEGMLGQVRQPGTLPPAAVATLCRGLALAPCVRVEHLHRLRAHLLGAGGLHGDA